MAKRYYLAYGSNLDEEQMAVRCPDARIVGTAVLDGWKLCFKYHADIEPCDGMAVPVLIWEISGRDEAALDRYEGYPHYYIKKDLLVTMTDFDGNQTDITAMVYTMTEGHPLRLPMEGYYRVLENGYRRFGFNTDILERALGEAGMGVSG